MEVRHLLPTEPRGRAGLCAAALLLFAAGCESTAPGRDSGVVDEVLTSRVPPEFRLARNAPGHRLHLGLTGDKAVLCRDCHDVSDGGFSIPSQAVCASCHKDAMKQHHPLDAGIDLTCLTCHPFGVKAATVQFDRWLCFDCHQKPQGQFVSDAGITFTRVSAIEVHKDDCQSCHRPHLKPFTQSAACEGCHDVTLKHGAKGDTLVDKCMNCHEHHTEASSASAMCVKCHTKPTITATARVTPGALFEKGHDGCGSCHLAHTFEKESVKPCAACHKQMQVLAEKDHASCGDCHRPHQPRSAAVTCESCHKDEIVKHPKVDGQRCIACHPVHDPRQLEPKGCLACHTEAPFNAPVVHAKDVTCDECHDSHDGKPATQRECKRCHDKAYVETARIQDVKGHKDCKGCHDTLPHGLASQKPCLSCHEKQKPVKKGHDTCDECHESHSGAVIKTCTQCHEVAKLPGLHAEKDHQACEKCHTAHAPDPSLSTAVCKTCHKALKLDTHPTPPTQCASCHLFTPAVSPSPSEKK
ncbi:MAG: cytochrome c3 family protein [Myxococcales bacterium]|nr:cytochrome c3 family protein [Myxococcales bacterium]